MDNILDMNTDNEKTWFSLSLKLKIHIVQI